MERTSELAILEDDAQFFSGFWRRFGAWFIDFVIVSIVMSIFSDLPFFGFILILAYFIGFWIWRGQTLGKMALGIKIVTTDGKRISFGTALLRLIIGYPVSAIILYLGFLLIAFDKRKQGLHDKIASTYVITKSGETAAQAVYTEYTQRLEKWESAGFDVTRLKKLLH